MADVDTRNVLARRGAHPLVGPTLCQWSTASLVRSRAFSRCVTVKPLPLERPSRLLLGPLFEFSHGDEDESAATDQPQLEADMFVEEIGRHPQCADPVRAARVGDAVAEDERRAVLERLVA